MKILISVFASFDIWIKMFEIDGQLVFQIFVTLDSKIGKI